MWKFYLPTLMCLFFDYLPTSHLYLYAFCGGADDSLMQVKQQSGSQQRQLRKKVRQRGEPGVVYPVDVWFLIGSYVSPEDVCTFACICRYTHVVAHSARFWLGLYHRLVADELFSQYTFNSML